MRIYSVGSLNIDYFYSVPHFVRAGETLPSAKLDILPGGKGLNQAVALIRAGADVVPCGLVGNDGEMLLDVLKSVGAKTDRVIKKDMSSGHAIIQVDPAGQNGIIVFHGANFAYDEAYFRKVLADAEPGDAVLLQNEINDVGLCMTVAKEKGMRVIFNPSPFDNSIFELPLEKVDLFLCNEIEGAAMTGKTAPDDILTVLCENYPNADALLTLGGAGAVYRDKTGVFRHGVFKVDVVDTTGAGDTFTGFFLAALNGGSAPADALRTASAASAIVVSRIGAALSIPTAEEVKEFLA
ncbi:MAG: ribokinase [Clostridia bacterium]|nr:ribokinase [Clostridia bacterium]